MKASLPDGAVWHDGELAVQQRAGVAEVSGHGIRSSIPEGALSFLNEQRLAVFGSTGPDGKIWASLRVGKPGFLHVLDPFTLQTASLEVSGDPLIENLKRNQDVGMVVIDFGTRRRMRLNGEAEILPDNGLRIRARQVYGNCQQYIQQRAPETESESKTGSVAATLISQAGQLNPDQRRWIEAADTLFIASAHPERGVDASHRGGNPGFVKVQSPNRLIIPDYHGNNMFNTLGNISVNPRTGLVFPDFERGRTLQLSGLAAVDWESDRSAFPGAERLLVFTIESVIEIEQPSLSGYRFQSYSPFNPKLPPPSRTAL